MVLRRPERSAKGLHRLLPEDRLGTRPHHPGGLVLNHPTNDFAQFFLMSDLITKNIGVFAVWLVARGCLE